MNRFVMSLLAAAVLGALAVAPAHASQPSHRAEPLSSPLTFTFIQYNSPGNDLPITNAKLNAEFVTISNPTSTARPLTGFHVHDVQHHSYTFSKFSLGPHKSVRLHTGQGHNTATNRYWGQKNYIWNNDGDTAYLVASTGSVTDICRWDAGPGSIHC